MPRSSESVAALASALAKAQAELVNPEKSLTATVRTGRPGDGERLLAIRAADGLPGEGLVHFQAGAAGTVQGDRHTRSRGWAEDGSTAFHFSGSVRDRAERCAAARLARREKALFDADRRLSRLSARLVARERLAEGFLRRPARPFVRSRFA